MPTFVATPKKSKGRSGRLWDRSRATVLARSQICWICAGECPDFKHPPGQLPFDSTAIDMTLAWPNPASASVDHIVPISQLGPDDPRLWRLDNLRPAHLSCNSKRGDGGNNNGHIFTKTSRNWLA